MAETTEHFAAVAATPWGSLGIRLKDRAVAGVVFLEPDVRPVVAADSYARQILQQIAAYVDNPAFSFSLPLALDGTPFQRRVWQILRAIPAGSVRTYGQLAERLGTSPRAVGGACRANPCPILVPCHRVVAVHGKGGYAGATTGRWMAIKDKLLQHEGAVRSP